MSEYRLSCLLSRRTTKAKSSTIQHIECFYIQVKIAHCSDYVLDKVKKVTFSQNSFSVLKFIVSTNNNIKPLYFSASMASLDVALTRYKLDQVRHPSTSRLYWHCTACTVKRLCLNVSVLLDGVFSSHIPDVNELYEYACSP